MAVPTQSSDQRTQIIVEFKARIQSSRDEIQTRFSRFNDQLKEDESRLLTKLDDIERDTIDKFNGSSASLPEILLVRENILGILKSNTTNTLLKNTLEMYDKEIEEITTKSVIKSTKIELNWKLDKLGIICEMNEIVDQNFKTTFPQPKDYSTSESISPIVEDHVETIRPVYRIISPYQESGPIEPMPTQQTFLPTNIERRQQHGSGQMLPPNQGSGPIEPMPIPRAYASRNTEPMQHASGPGQPYQTHGSQMQPKQTPGDPSTLTQPFNPSTIEMGPMNKQNVSGQLGYSHDSSRTITAHEPTQLYPVSTQSNIGYSNVQDPSMGFSLAHGQGGKPPYGYKQEDLSQSHQSPNVSPHVQPSSAQNRGGMQYGHPPLQGNYTMPTSVSQTDMNRWSCPHCTYSNPGNRSICEQCCKSNNFNTDIPFEVPTARQSTGIKYCPKCHHPNRMKDVACTKCHSSIVHSMQ